MSFQTHLASLLDAQLQTFGVSVAYTPAATGVPATIKALKASWPAAQPIFPGHLGSIEVRAVDVTPADGDSVEFGGVTLLVRSFVIAKHGPDANGDDQAVSYLLHLHKQR